jgi:large subunit ribosomal protein L29
MKASEIRDLDDRELTKHLAETRKEVFGLRFSNATGELDNTAGLSRARRDLARALTVARERELAAVPATVTEQYTTGRADRNG